MTMPFTPDSNGPLGSAFAVMGFDDPYDSQPAWTRNVHLAREWRDVVELYSKDQVERVIAHIKEERDSYQRVGIAAQEQIDKLTAPLHAQLKQLNDGWIAACKERDRLKDILALLAPDLKVMAILYAQQGNHERSQALAYIAKSVGAA